MVIDIWTALKAILSQPRLLSSNLNVFNINRLYLHESLEMRGHGVWLVKMDLLILKLHVAYATILFIIQKKRTSKKVTCMKK